MFNTIKKNLLFIMLLSSAIQQSYAQSLSDLDIPMTEDSIRTVRLTSVTMLPSHSFFDEKGRADIHFSYETYLDMKGEYTSKSRTDVRLLPTDINGVYKVEEISFPGTRYGPDGASDAGYPESPQWSFTGYSDNTTLIPVRVYNYYLQHAPVYELYEPEQLDEKPYFTFDGSKQDFKEYISGRLKGYSQFTDNLRGTVTFSFEIDSCGRALNFQVDEINLEPKNDSIRINGDTDIDFARQIDILFRSLNYMVVEYGFYIRHPNRYWSPGKINDEAVASKQHLTFKFK